LKYYTVAEIEIKDRGWIPSYVKDVTRMVEKHGGRYLTRTSNLEKIEGARKAPQIFLIVEWPSKEAADAFYESQEYKPYLQSRLAGASSEMLLVAGEDMMKTARTAE
jgi:uncharacterized protein (DUF1330 family)